MDLVQRGALTEALTLGLARLERDAGGSAVERSQLGQLMVAVLLASGREEQAEELMEQQLRIYEDVSRLHLRWMSTLDRGGLYLALRRPGRAAELLNALADDDEAPPALRVEALAALALALQDLGEYRRANQTLKFADSLAAGLPGPTRVAVLNALKLELVCLRRVRNLEQAADASSSTMSRQGPEELAGPALSASLQAAQAQVASVPIAAERLRLLAALTSDLRSDQAAVAQVSESLRWLRERRLTAQEEGARIEAALAYAHQSCHRQASEVLAVLALDELHLKRHRQAMELRFVLSRGHAAEGRYPEALRCHRELTADSLARLRHELPRLPYSRFLEKATMCEQHDAFELQLPVRYRKAYRYIIEHLDERGLSIRHVAAHIDVTERALQMAFRSHLGMTPAELIRRRRMECIRTELQHSSNHQSVLSVATRWGLDNRSTLAQNYRKRFGESPTATLRASA